MSCAEAAEDPVKLQQLGSKYARGTGVKKDMAKAIQLWKQAAKLGRMTLSCICCVRELPNVS